jgi:Ferritin-like domain
MARSRSNHLRAALTLVTLMAALAATGCGRSGHGAETDPDKASDVAILNAALAREQTAAEAYRRGLSRLSGSMAVVGRRLRAAEQEYIDALTKAIRGLGGETDEGAAELDPAGFRNRTDFLLLAYRLENAALAYYVDAAPQLIAAVPRTLATTLAVGHAQHLVVLRQGLGEGPAASVPDAFEVGETPPPSDQAPVGAG